MRRYWVYILSNRTRVLYVGVTNNLLSRIQEHKEHRYPHAFTRRYNINCLVYFETVSSASIAVAREKQIKGLSRAKKIKLIEARNPDWRDLSADSAPG